MPLIHGNSGHSQGDYVQYLGYTCAEKVSTAELYGNTTEKSPPSKNNIFGKCK